MQPLLGAPHAGRIRAAPATDTPAVRVAAVLRLAVLISLAAVGSFLPHPTGRRAALLLLIGLVWVPWATALLFSSERDGDRLVSVAGPVGDVLVLAVAQWSFPAANAGILLGYLVIVVFTLYTAGPRVAAVIGAAAIGAALASQDLVPHPDRLGAAVLVPFMVAVAALVTLLERTAILQARAVERYRRLESKSDTVLAHVADAIVVTGEGGVVVQCNRAARTMVGGGDDLGGRGCEQALSLHQGERRLDCSVDCGLLRLAGGTNASGVEVWREGPSGVRQPLLADAVAVESPGDRTEVVHSFRDITGLKQAEEAKTLFLATATHELKTPLTVISGFAETLARYDHIPPEVQSAALDAIRSRAAELTHIVDRLLLSSRIEAGRLRLAVERIDPGPIVAERVAVLAPALHRDIGCRVDDGLPLVEGTPQALATVVDHLVDNAVKYSPDGQPVEVRVQQGEPGVRIEVSDQGIGMDPEQTARCFDKFWQAESTDVRRFGGTGIGLYIVRSLVEAMGGSLSVRSVAGAGTTFTVGLVATPDRLTEDPGEHLAEDPGVGERTSIREFMRQIGIRERT